MENEKGDDTRLFLLTSIESEMERQRNGKTKKWLSVLLLCLIMFGCSSPDPEVERRTALAATFARLQSCAPNDEGEGDLKLAIVSATRQPTETSVRLVGYALDKSVEFDLPVYLLSRGRWLINETGRAYLLDEQCQEYKLKERKSSSIREAPPDGQIRLEAGQAFEVTLSFPPLSEKARMGVLVYGRRVLPFSLGPLPADQAR